MSVVYKKLGCTLTLQMQKRIQKSILMEGVWNIFDLIGKEKATAF
jgi:hypothetical protein